MDVTLFGMYMLWFAYKNNIYHMKDTFFNKYSLVAK